MYVLEWLGWGALFVVTASVVYYLLALLIFIAAKFGAIGFYVGRKRFHVIDRKDTRKNDKGKTT